MGRDGAVLVCDEARLAAEPLCRDADELSQGRASEKGEVLRRGSALYDIVQLILTESSACQVHVCAVAA